MQMRHGFDWWCGNKGVLHLFLHKLTLIFIYNSIKSQLGSLPFCSFFEVLHKSQKEPKIIIRRNYKLPHFVGNFPAQFGEKQKSGLKVPQLSPAFVSIFSFSLSLLIFQEALWNETAFSFIIKPFNSRPLKAA